MDTTKTRKRINRQTECMIDTLAPIIVAQGPDEFHALPKHYQEQVEQIPFDTVADAQTFADMIKMETSIKYSFVANVRGTLWRVYPGYQLPEKIKKGAL